MLIAVQPGGVGEALYSHIGALISFQRSKLENKSNNRRPKLGTSRLFVA